MKSKITLVAVIVFGAAVAMFSVGAASSRAPVFEYKVIHANGGDSEAALNREGSAGWELVAVNVTSGGAIDTIVFLKRQVR